MIKNKKPLVITATGNTSWNVDKYYVQEYPKAMSILGKEDETTIHLYNESLEAFKRSNTARITITTTDEFKFDREKETPLYSRNKDRLFLLGFETKLKRLFSYYNNDIEKALHHIKQNQSLPEVKTNLHKDKK